MQTSEQELLLPTLVTGVVDVEEASVSRHVQQQHTVRGQLFEPRGEEDKELAESGLVQQVLVGVLSLAWAAVSCATVFRLQPHTGKTSLSVKNCSSTLET